jgi:hypothetical protein
MCFRREQQDRKRYGNYAEKQTLLIHGLMCFVMGIRESVEKEEIEALFDVADVIIVG